ncbi:hypothetical protein SteCoe_21008 [Stentor coeruleus]|uniref:Uncharacterized protein n=1 Tax=Stentor coeruleus TaxID=5963 RepID=A0A1R2BQI8_9CILI|nr:hypothetical protein SteCoe_21008 [Stentor coeruleus]
MKKKEFNLDPTMEELKAEVKKYRQIILNQQEKIATIPQLENEIEESEKKLAMELSKLNNKYQNEIEQCSKEMKQYKNMAAKNVQLEEKVKLLTMEIDSFRRQYHKEIDSDNRVAQLQELVATRSKEIQKLEISCNRLKVQLNLKNQEIQKLSNRIIVIEHEVEELSKTKKPQDIEPTVKDESLNSLARYYKKKLEEKDLELKKLSKRMSKMQRVEVQCKIKEEGFESERKEYLDRIAELCKSNKNLEKIAQQNYTKPRISVDESKKREGIIHANYENMVELTRSATEAFNSLVHKEKFSGRSTRPTTAGDSRWSRVNSAHKLHIHT